MWILPENYPHFSVPAPDTEDSTQELKRLSDLLAQSVSWRSKASASKTWSIRWRRESWVRSLSGRILEPSLHTSFEEKLTYSLLAIHANHLAVPVEDEGRRTPGTFGRTSEGQLMLFNPESSSLKTWRDTSPWACGKSLPTYIASDTEWKTTVANQRGEYSVRRSASIAMENALHTDENESLSWASATTSRGGHTQRDGTLSPKLDQQVKLWPTASARDHKDTPGMSVERPDRKSGRIDQLPRAVYNCGRLGPEKNNTNGKETE